VVVVVVVVVAVVVVAAEVAEVVVVVAAEVAEVVVVVAAEVVVVVVAVAIRGAELRRVMACSLQSLGTSRHAPHTADTMTASPHTQKLGKYFQTARQ